jgi:hypothetical protein
MNSGRVGCPGDTVSTGATYQFDAPPGTGNNLCNRGAHDYKKSHKRQDRRQTENMVCLVTAAIMPGLRSTRKLYSRLL